jgi:peptidoglycan/LPS O-acetylase OafA/YrhL
VTSLPKLVLPTFRARHRSAGHEAVTSTVSHRLHEIDLLRFGAALSVVAYHYLFSAYGGGHSPLAFPAAGQIARYGYLGVDLFFVISGFVVLMTAWDRPPRSFIVSRVVRLYPAYWIAVSATTLVSIVAGDERYHVTAAQYLANLTMLNALVDV